MIYDEIKNWKRYATMAEPMGKALQLLQQLVDDYAAGKTPVSGRHDVECGIFYNVDVYTTKIENVVGYESHCKYIDIQCLLEGEERILVKPISDLHCTMSYEPSRDAAFYAHDTHDASELVLRSGRFAIFHPNDGHEPQLCYTDPMPVIKVVIKVPMN